MSASTNGNEPLPFWQWKQEQYAKDQAAGTPHSKEWYYRAYGGYCNKVRKQNEKSSAAKESDWGPYERQ